MNLGQAVAVCLYELSARVFSPQQHAASESLVSLQNAGTPPTPSANLDLLAGVIEQTMLASGYSPASMHAANRHDLRLLLRRLAPGIRDTRRILGLFRRILWRLQQPPGER